jgi:Fe-S-cluster containining protein
VPKQPKRKPAPVWECHRCGDCCTKPEWLTLTDAELDQVILASGARYDLQVRQLPQGFAQLKTGPCPFHFRDKHGRAGCAVYEARPYNCRRYMCGRPTCETEWDPAPVPKIVAETKALRLVYRDQQKRCMWWALRHGWSNKDKQEG